MIFVVATIIFLVTLTSFLYVAGEFAIVAVRIAQVQKMASSGNDLARRLQAVLDNPQLLDRYIAACQIGITFTQLFLGAYAVINLSPRCAAFFMIHAGLDAEAAAWVGNACVLILLTSSQIIFAELLPKGLALRYSNRMALALYWPLNISARLFKPFIWLLNSSGNALLTLFGIPLTSHKHIHSLQEIELLLAESKEGGLLDPQEHQRLHHALELSQQTAKQLMTPRTKLAAVSSSMSINECYALALKSPFTRLLVYGDNIDDVRGIVNVKDIISARAARPRETGFEHLVKNVPIVPENLSMDRLIKELKEAQSHAAIVMDEYGGTLGIVTVGDIFAELMGQTERDEFKQMPKVEVLEDGRVRLPGWYKLRRAKKFIGNFPDTESDTVNGLLIESLGRVPEPGEVVQMKDVVLEVVGVEGNAVTYVLAKRLEPAE